MGELAAGVSMKPLISVIIPNYNYGDYVAQAVESVIRQSYTNLEIFIVDDGSTDNSREILAKYSGQCEVIHRCNSGQLNACRAVSSKIRGEYVYILDSDDYLIDPSVFASIQPFMEQNPSKIQFQLVPVNAKNEVLGKPFPQFPSKYETAQLIDEIFKNASYLTPPTSGNMYRRDVWEFVNTVTYHDYADGIAYLAAPFFGSVITISKPFACHRLHSANHSAFRPDLERLNDKISVITNRIHHLKKIVGADSSTQIRVPEHYFIVKDLLLCRYLSQGVRPPIILLLSACIALKRSKQPFLKKLAFIGWIASIAFLPVRISIRIATQRISPRRRTSLLKAIADL